MNSEILLVLNKIKPFVLETDISFKVWRVVLKQYDYNEELKVYSYLSKAFNLTERNY